MMIVSMWRLRVIAGCLFLSLLLVSCIGKAPTIAYYTLPAIGQSDPSAEAIAQLDVTLGIGPVTIPDYLKKAQIATRLGDNRYQFNGSHRWAGMIEQNITSVLGNNLGLLLGTDEVVFFPWQHYLKPEYHVIVDIIQFDSDLKNDAVLSVRWAVNDASGERVLASGKSDYRQALDNPSYKALIEAESLTLAEFSRELAMTLKTLALQK